MKKEYRIEKHDVAKKQEPLFSLKEVWFEGREIVYAFDTNTIPQFNSVDSPEEIHLEVIKIYNAFKKPFIRLNEKGEWKELTKKTCFKKQTISHDVEHGKK